MGGEEWHDELSAVGTIEGDGALFGWENEIIDFITRLGFSCQEACNSIQMPSLVALTRAVPMCHQRGSISPCRVMAFTVDLSGELENPSRL